MPIGLIMGNNAKNENKKEFKKELEYDIHTS
jgi:hypothetical protein